MENNITKLKKKQTDLEEAAKKPAAEHAQLRTYSTRPKNQSIAQLIYADNRRKAAQAHDVLTSLGPPIDLPLYHQPSDTGSYVRNRNQYLAFRPRLLKFLRRRQQEKDGRHRYLTLTYNKYMAEWSKRVSELEKVNNVPLTTAPGVNAATGPTSAASTNAATSSATPATTVR